MLLDALIHWYQYFAWNCFQEPPKSHRFSLLALSNTLYILEIFKIYGLREFYLHVCLSLVIYLSPSLKFCKIIHFEINSSSKQTTPQNIKRLFYTQSPARDAARRSSAISRRRKFDKNTLNNTCIEKTNVQWVYNAVLVKSGY